MSSLRDNQERLTVTRIVTISIIGEYIDVKLNLTNFKTYQYLIKS